MKRVFAVLLAVMMLAAVATGCGKKTVGAGEFDPSALEGLTGFQASKEPLTLTAHIMNFDDEKWDVYHEAARHTNITVKGTVAKSQADSAQAFNMMLLQDKMPDIIHGSISNLNNAGMKEKALVDIKPYVTDPNVMPHLAAIYAEHPDYLISVTAPDGGVYICPKLREEGPTQGWYTRSDWMEKLGLEDPKTYDEFVHVMDRMRNGDPNGNGKKDEIPYFGDVKHLFYLFGINGGRYWDINEQDDMFCPRLTENYKLALKTIADWYKKGYIDQEIFTRSNPRGMLWGHNTGGMTFNWFSSTMSYNEQIKNVPGFHISVMDPPANIHGDAPYCHSPGNIVDSTGWGVSVDNEHLAETLRYFDFWYSDTGSLLNAMGIEERDYYYLKDANGNYIDYDGNPTTDKSKGAVKYTELATNYEGGAPQYVRDIGCIGIGYYMRQKWLLSGMTDEGAAGQKHYNEDIVTCKLVPPYSFTDAEQQVIDTEWTACQTKIDEYMQQAIYGTIDVDATWDEHVQLIKDLGIEKVAKAHNAAYDRYTTAVANIGK